LQKVGLASVVIQKLRTRSHVEKALKGKKRALETAAGLGDVSLLRMLLEADALLDCEALHEALREKHKDAVRYLLSVGANVNHLDEYGKPPLELAIKDGCLEIVQILIDAKADVSVSSQGGSDLHAVLLLDRNHSYASELGKEHTVIPQVVQVLLKAGADVNIGGPRGTALQLAAEQGRLAIVHFLLEGGVDVGAGRQYSMALRGASKHGYGVVVKVLLDATAQLDGFNYYQACYNALEVASRYRHKGVVEMLSDPAVKFLLAQTANGHLPEAIRQRLLTYVCDVDDYVLQLAMQHKNNDLANAISAIWSLKDSLADGSNEALGRSLEVFLPSPAR